MSKYPSATIETLLITQDAGDFCTTPLPRATFDHDGMVGNVRHRGRTRLADMRIKAYVRDQDTVLDRQQISIVDTDSLDHIAGELELDEDLLASRHEGNTSRLFLARCMGANIVFAGFQGTGEVPSFHDLANATDFGPYDPDAEKFTAATAMITRYNGPCVHPGKKIEEHYPGKSDGMAEKFVQAALGRRGFVGMVVKAGIISAGQEVTFIPLPRP